MNREQRRAQERQQRKGGLTASPLNQSVRINYGHDDEHIVMQFTAPIQNLVLTPEQADAMIGAVREAQGRLQEHQGKQQAEQEAHG